MSSLPMSLPCKPSGTDDNATSSEPECFVSIWAKFPWKILGFMNAISNSSHPKKMRYTSG